MPAGRCAGPAEAGAGRPFLDLVPPTTRLRGPVLRPQLPGRSVLLIGGRELESRPLPRSPARFPPAARGGSSAARSPFVAQRPRSAGQRRLASRPTPSPPPAGGRPGG